MQAAMQCTSHAALALHLNHLQDKTEQQPQKQQTPKNLRKTPQLSLQATVHRAGLQHAW
jgi:hypothetical protein